MVFAHIEDNEVTNVAEWSIRSTAPDGWIPTEDKDVAIGDSYADGVFLSPDDEPRKNTTDRLQDVYFSVEKLGLPLDKAAEVRTLIDELLMSVEDKDVPKYIDLIPELTGDGRLVKEGTLVLRDGTIQRAAADLVDTAKNAADLFVDIQKPIEGKDISDVIVVGRK